MARPTKASGSSEVQRLRQSLAREKQKRLAAEGSLRDSRAQQDAINEILNVIRRSPADPKPVFDAIVRRALALLGGHSAALTQISGGLLHLVALTSTSPAGDAAMRSRYPRPVSKETSHGRAALSRKPFAVLDNEKVRST